MRGRGHRKKSSRANDAETHDSSKSKAIEAGIMRKARKKGKHWRFAYDLYCKELISSNQPAAATQRSIERPGENAFKQGGGKALQAQTTYPRHTTSNSMSRRDQLLRHLAASNNNP